MAVLQRWHAAVRVHRCASSACGLVAAGQGWQVAMPFIPKAPVRGPHLATPIVAVESPDQLAQARATTTSISSCASSRRCGLFQVRRFKSARKRRAPARLLGCRRSASPAHARPAQGQDAHNWPKILSSWLARDHPLAPARRRSAATDVSVQNNMSVNYTFRWHNSDDDKRAEAERLRDTGKPVASIAWGDGSKTLDHEAGPGPSSKD